MGSKTKKVFVTVEMDREKRGAPEELFAMVQLDPKHCPTCEWISKRLRNGRGVDTIAVGAGGVDEESPKGKLFEKIEDWVDSHTLKIPFVVPHRIERGRRCFHIPVEIKTGTGFPLVCLVGKPRYYQHLGGVGLCWDVFEVDDPFLAGDKCSCCGRPVDKIREH